MDKGRLRKTQRLKATPKAHRSHLESHLWIELRCQTQTVAEVEQAARAATVEAAREKAGEEAKAMVDGLEACYGRL